MKKYFIISSIIIFIIGFMFHYLYPLSNNCFLTGLFTPVNESIFEHLKLILYPTLIWWILFYIFKKNKYDINIDSWFLSSLISVIISLIILPSIYYLFKCGFNIENSYLNISIMYITILFSQLISLIIYNIKIKINILIIIILISLIIIVFTYLTIYPPKLPFFQDPLTNTYGIFSN